MNDPEARAAAALLLGARQPAAEDDLLRRLRALAEQAG
jgi:hypothetical protein